MGGLADFRISGRLFLSPLIVVVIFSVPAVAAYAGLVTEKTLLSLLPAAIVLSFASSVFVLAKTVTKPIRAIEAAAKKVSEGDLSFPVSVKSSDEIGRMALLLKESFISLGEILQRIKDLAEKISKVAEEVDKGSKKVVKGAEAEAEAIENISNSVCELNATAAEIAENTEGLSSLMGETTAAVTQMVSSVASIDTSIQELSLLIETTSSSIAQLSAAIKEVAANAGELDVSTEETLSAVSEISSAIKEIEVNARESARLSEQVTNEAATLGMATIEKTIAGMRGIENSVTHTAGIMQDLGKRSDEIGKILTVIGDITDETTLLSLNAAILAAQAGEHGKGFSVVADEIKKLAEQTDFSTREIASLITSVQEGVKNAGRAMEECLHSTAEGSNLAGAAGEALRKILDISRVSSGTARSIERSTTEQAKGASFITGAMDRVRKMTEHIARATAEQSRGISLVMEAAEKMRGTSQEVARATTEQAVANRQISHAVETVFERTQQISRSLAEHKAGSKVILESVEAMKDLPAENRRLIFGVGNLLRTLNKDADLGKTEMERFRFHEEGREVVKFGVIALESPATAYKKFTPLVEYLGARLGRRVKVKVAVDLETAIRDIGQGVTQLAFMGPLTYIEAHSRYGVDVLVKALRDGRPFHRSVIVTRADSGITRARDLRGKTFAFVDVKSSYGFIIPQAMLGEAGVGLEDLKYHHFLGNHDDVARAVLKGDFDAGGVMESIFHKFADQGLTILERSEEIPEVNICMNRSLGEKDLSLIRDALIVLNRSSDEGTAILKAIDKGYTGFVPAYDSDYNELREKMARQNEVKVRRPSSDARPVFAGAGGNGRW